jgi:hypothetical protein
MELSEDEVDENGSRRKKLPENGVIRLTEGQYKNELLFSFIVTICSSFSRSVYILVSTSGEGSIHLHLVLTKRAECVIFIF